ncbi:MAG: hypothetical protein WC877_00365 [Dehalococcoidales bacterium]|jgi:hypothetical protein
MKTEQEIRGRIESLEKLLKTFGFDCSIEASRLQLQWVLGEES